MLSKPSKELATKVLAGVNLDSGIALKSLVSQGEDGGKWLCSFREVIGFLGLDSGAVSTVAAIGFVSYLDLNDLQEWIASAFDDTELAEAIGRKLKEDKGYKESAEFTRELMAWRLKQSEAVVQEQ